MDHTIHIFGAAQVTVSRVTRVRGRGMEKVRRLQIRISDAEGNEMATVDVASNDTAFDLIVGREGEPEGAEKMLDKDAT